MKAFVVYQSCGFSAQDWHAMLIREDGACLGDHICSHENFMLGDLWLRRKELQAKHPDLIVEAKPQHIETFKDTHKEVFDKAFEVSTQERQSPNDEAGT